MKEELIALVCFNLCYVAVFVTGNNKTRVLTRCMTKARVED